MTNDEFIFWLQGFNELSSNKKLDDKKIWIINNHANLVKSVDGKLNKKVTCILEKLKVGDYISTIL